MGKDRVYSKLTIEDIEEINKSQLKEIRVTSTKSIDLELIDRLDPNIKIVVVGNEEKRDERLPEYSYKISEFKEIVLTLTSLEQGLYNNPNWTDLDRFVYLYSKLIYYYSLSGFDKTLEADSSLRSLLNRIPNPKALALIYSELCNRNGLDARYLENVENTSAFNEIRLGDKYYPVDAYLDYETSRQEPGSIYIHNFGKNAEFYFMPQHQLKEVDTKFEPLNRDDVQNSLNRVIDQIGSEYKELFYEKRQQKVIRPDIPVISKELKGLFKEDIVTEDNIRSLERLTIKLTDEDTDVLDSDLKVLGQFYPEVLSKVTIENDSGKTIDLQKTIDSVYEAKYPGVYDKTISSEEASKRTVDQPLDLKIVVNSQEDLDQIDLTHAPKYEPRPEDMIKSEDALFNNDNQVTLSNSGSSSMSITDIRTKVSSSCECFHLEGNGWDLANADFAGTNITLFTVEGQHTRNIDRVRNIDKIISFSVYNIPNDELDKALTTFNRVIRFRIANQDLHDRAILREFRSNPNIGDIEIYRSHLNKLDGLEDLDGRLGTLEIVGNDLGTNDLERLFEFVRRNPNLTYEFDNNSGVNSKINSSMELSNETFNLLKTMNENSGLTPYTRVTDKKSAINYLLWNRNQYPVYIQDARLLREELKITTNPLILNNDNELNTINFNEPYLRDATLLLTISQARQLINSGKRIPQKINLRIENANDLSIHEAEELKSLMATKGLQLAGVQIIDPHHQTRESQTRSYPIDEYIEIRKVLDILVSGIDPSEPDIDKFAVIYQRLMDSVTYDFDGTDDKLKTHADMIKYASLYDTCRNLRNGLLDGKCVCAGYADLLRNALSLVGIDARQNRGPGHAWNQVCLKDEHGNKKWYNTDLTWDAYSHSYDWTLLSDASFVEPGGTDKHKRTTPHTELADTDYDRVKLREAFARARARSFNIRTAEAPIAIPNDPNIPVSIPNSAQIKAEFTQRKNDMYAKYYGDKDYRKEYQTRNNRFKSHRVSRNDGTYDYETIEDYPEREEDESFLLLDKYATCLERMTRYQNGDTSVYTGTPDQITRALAKDREYVETNNHTFNQNRTAREDLMTLGKYGEKVPYMPRQSTALKNVARGIVNVFIFGRNLVAPVYRFIGRHVAVPIHKLIYGNSDPSPFRNNFYHRMVARRDYFSDENNRTNPGHPIINAIKARGQAIFNYKKGNEAVLRAGAADIRRNTEQQLREKLLISNLAQQSRELTTQINFLRTEIANHPRATNIAEAQTALNDKIAKKQRIDNRLGKLKADGIGIAQTDAISDKQHAIASKEVTTLKVTAIKGVAKVAAAKFIGPKLCDWLASKGKVTKPVQKTVKVSEEKERWVNPTYKIEKQRIYGTKFESDTSLADMMAGNKGKEITGFYSVWGGERRPATYTLTGDENITAVFHSVESGGHGLADTVGLRAPNLVDGTFSEEMLDAAGKLSQKISLSNLVHAVKSGEINPATLGDVYVSIDDQYWARLADLTDGLMNTVQVGNKINRVIDVPGHMETYTELVDKVINTTEVITIPAFERAAHITAGVGEGAMILDTIYDINENLRETKTDKKSNKQQPRDYTFDKDLDEVPTTRKAYKEGKDERD